MGEGRFRTLLSVIFKLRNFDPLHRCNATEASAWVYYIPTSHYPLNNKVWCFVVLIILLGVGWLALLILEVGAMRRPEDGDRHGETTPTSFLFLIAKTIIYAKFEELQAKL